MSSENLDVSPNLVFEFNCAYLPSTVPCWINVEARVTEPGYYCTICYKDYQAEGLLDQLLDEDSIEAFLSVLGFEDVDCVHWRLESNE